MVYLVLFGYFQFIGISVKTLKLIIGVVNVVGILIRCIFVSTKTDIIISTSEILGAETGQKKWLNVTKITSCQDVGFIIFGSETVDYIEEIAWSPELKLNNCIITIQVLAQSGALYCGKFLPR